MSSAFGSYEISHSSGRSFSATTKLFRGAASYTAETRELVFSSLTKFSSGRKS